MNLALFISYIFLFDFNRYPISIFSTSTQLLSSEVYRFIYDFKRDKNGFVMQLKRQSVEAWQNESIIIIHQSKDKKFSTQSTM